MSRQRLVLTLVFGLLLLALGYAYWATPRQQKVAALGASKAGQAKEEKGAARPDRPQGALRLDLLERGEGDYSGFKRDLFSLHKPSPPPAPLTPPKPMPAPMPVPPPTPAAETGLQSAQRALGQFIFLGFLQKDGAKTLFLSNQGEIFVAKKGDAFGKHKEFVITEVTADSLTIRQANGPGSMTVSLVEQRPLAPVANQPQQMVRPPRPNLPPMTIQPLPEDLARQAAESGNVQLPPEAEPPPEPVEEPSQESPAPLQFGPKRISPSPQAQPVPGTPPGASAPSGLQLPGMN